MKKLLHFILFCPFILVSQIQIGSDIDGEAAGDYSGVSVSLSSDGSIIAIGAYVNNGNGDASGHVRVYKNENDAWMKIGQDIDGEAVGDVSGIELSLSSDGTIVAIGAPSNDENGNSSGQVRIYKNIENIWVQIGQDIDGEAAYQETGRSVSLSSDGSIVAIGSVGFYGYNSVKIYKNEAGTWTQIGNDIDGEMVDDESGRSVSLSSDGSILAIGARFSNSGNNEGYVRVYRNKAGTWIKIGDSIYGESNFDESGYSVSLSSDGSILAIGAPGNDNNGTDSGYVRVYKNENDTWSQIGYNIDGEAAYDESGRNVSLSSNGSILVIGAHVNDGNGYASGHVRVYKNESGMWTQIGSDIDGEAAFDNSGISVSLSSNGSIVAIGAYNNNGNGENSGHVRVYDLTAVLSTESFNQNYFSFYPNPVKDELNVELKKGLELNKINIYNVHSQYLYSTKALKIDTKNLTSGIYFIEVETNKGKSAKKIVIQ